MMFGDAFERARLINRKPRELMMQPMDWKGALPGARTAVEIKFNGIGYIWASREALTRQGAPFECAAHLAPLVDDLERRLGGYYALQGEFVEPEGFDAALASFQRGTSRTGILQIFDAVPMGAWLGEEISAPLWQRRQLLEAAFEFMPKGRGLYLAQQATGFDVEGVEMAFGEALAGGHEGIVAKDLDSPFVRAKSPFWLRIKGRWSVDVPIKAIHRSSPSMMTPHRVPRLEKIICDYEGQPIAIPHGFTEAQRADVEQFRIGRIVEIEHDGVTRAGFLKSPRFKRFRDDKGDGR